MTTLELLAALRAAGVGITTDSGTLKVTAPKGALTEVLRAGIAGRKAELLRLLAPNETSEPELRRMPPGTRARLSLGQERLWSLAAHAPRSARYNLPLAFRITGQLDVSALKASLSRIIARHEILRYSVRTSEAGPSFESAEADAPFAFSQEDAPPDAGAAWLEQRAREEAVIPFDVTAGRFIRFRLVRVSPEDHVFTVVMHHLVSDGWSFEVFFDELELLYAGTLLSRPVDLPELKVQYADVAAWERARLTPERRVQAEAFWRDLYSDGATPLQLPSPDPDGVASRDTLALPDDVIARVAELASAEACSPFVVSLAAYSILLASVTHSTDVVLCSPTAGRDREELRGLIGYLNNVLPLRIRLHPDHTFRTHLRATRDHVLAASANHALPFQDIANLPETARTPLARGMFAYHGQALRSLRLDGVSISSIPVSAGTADFDVALSVDGTADGVEATLVSRPGTLGPHEPADVLNEYLRVLARAVRNPEALLSDLMSEVAISVGRSVPVDANTSAPDGARWTQEPSEVVLAGDPLELQLSLIWEHALRIRPIAPDDNFFDLGGHSLLAVQILDTIEREMGVRLTLGVLSDSPTVRSLARAVGETGWSPSEDCLVPMDASPRGDPLIFVHSFEGHTFIFNELVRRFGGRIPTYGLQAVGLGDGKRPHRSVEEMAEHYLEELDRHFGSSPVTLVGMCFGFSISLEMAARRAAQGNPVRLILIDGAWDHLRPDNELGGDVPLITRLKRHLRRGFERGKWALDGVRRRMTTSPYARREAAIRRRTVDAWYAYHPQPYPGEITLIRAHETANDPERAWQLAAMQSIATGGLSTVIVPGHHYTILRDPHVEELAEQVMRAAGTGSLARSGSEWNPSGETF